MTSSAQRAERQWARLFYLTALGLSSFALLLPCRGRSCLVTFWPKSKGLARLWFEKLLHHQTYTPVKSIARKEHLLRATRLPLF